MPTPDEVLEHVTTALRSAVSGPLEQPPITWMIDEELTRIAALGGTPKRIVLNRRDSAALVEAALGAGAGQSPAGLYRGILVELTRNPDGESSVEAVYGAGTTRR